MQIYLSGVTTVTLVVTFCVGLDQTEQVIDFHIMNVNSLSKKNRQADARCLDIPQQYLHTYDEEICSVSECQ